MAYSVLIIDDEPHFCNSIKVLLEAGNYEADTANSGQEALFLFEKKKYDAALLDIGLPDISGNEVAARLNEHYPDTAVIILTGQATIDNAIAALRSGVYDYLRKPYDPEQLLWVLGRGIQHKRLEKQLKASEKRFRQLAEATWEGIFIYEEGTLLQVNSQLCEMFGYSSDELIGKKIFDVLLNRSSIKSLNLQADPDTIGPFEALGIKKDGTTFPVEIRIKYIDYDDRMVQVAAIRDRSDWQRAIQQQLALQDQLASAKRMESLGIMAGSVAHDLNNIMAGIIIYPDLLLLDLPEDFPFREEIKLIRDAGVRAAAVVSDLLTVARGTNCQKEVQNINAIITGYFDSAECKEIKRRYPGIIFESELDTKLWNTRCSAIHISKSITNLINNAAEALDNSGRIKICTQNRSVENPIKGYETIAPGEYTVITVEDDGPGISEEDQKRIFEPFYSKKVMGRSGTGLGLTIVWDTVHEHGGYVDLTSDSSGTRISLYFPATHERLASARTTSSFTTRLGKGQNVLVVDDQESQREIARRLLARLGYQVHTAESGEEAIEFIKNHPVDLVLLDMVMEPGIDGFETYKRIRELVPDQKAIIISGLPDSKEMEEARKLGISQFIRKPFSLQELGQALSSEILNQQQ